MSTIKINSTNVIGEIKPMHAVNNGPAAGPGRIRGNFESFAALNIPYVRNHDASLSEAYGSQHLVDIHCIFTDFSKDENDETNYDFTLTDVYTKNILDAGSKVFYRLGSSIEHWAKKYGTLVPDDFEKWARICEHIIMHYNEGWADGFEYNIEYWEIWNEPDLDPDDCANKLTWGGAKSQFFDFYNVTATYLKNRFPHLKIGGPAIAGNLEWAEEFLAQLDAPLDFFSYHRYAYEPKFIAETGIKVKELLSKYGYENAECILNEWNYVKDWNDPFEYISTIKGTKGAVFVAASMCEAQNTGVIDMLMYYDARVEKTWNGLFDSDTLKPIKGYYAFKAFSELYQLGTQVECDCDDNALSIVAAKNEDSISTMICYYTMDENAEEKDIMFNIDSKKAFDLYLLDDENNLTKQNTVENNSTITISPNSVILLTDAKNLN